ncbi:hypothetical protein [Anaeromyxobacter dehalogenans]|uniref:Uncharacterized protein n=1 Tax=Anaeromyxobacter dehalogenans (strain 2CP-C) TaxID=290397 RepID=Q2IJ18_ANADE|nr:hypothetical protein [Anaeromyxobacter dehalogenans]ABC81652.1 hypothetical protein Adeh_1881 [Anaeromyxobacter dehalogenans 2CP-C]
MNRAKIDRLAGMVSELVARRTAERVAPLAADELRAAGFRVPCTWSDGLSVNVAPGLDAKLAELGAKGIRPGMVVLIRNLASEPPAPCSWESGS